MEAETSPNRADKRKTVFSASVQLPKKRKVQSYLDPRNIRDKLGAWKELKRLQETENRPDLPSLFTNEGPPVIIQAQSPSKTAVLTPCNWEIPSKAAPIECETEVKVLKATINSLQSQVDSLTQRVVAAESYRKLLQGHILDLKGAIRVICRVSPCIPASSLLIEYPEAGFGGGQLHTIAVNLGFARLNFTCDQVLPPETTQTQIFAEVQSYIQAAIDGQQVTILAYGATGSGKSYTMEGNQRDAGILPRAADYLFEGMRQQHLSASLRLVASCLYISDDYLHDLLCPQSHRLSIKSLGGKVVVDLLSWHEVTSPQQLLSLWRTAQDCRRNEHASHCLFQVVLEGSDASGKIIEGQLNLVELAGADEAKGPDRKWLESTFTALKKVISGRIRPTKVACLPAYRDSKLTRILQDSLSTGKVLFLVTVASDLSKAAETRQTLGYASDLQTM